MSNFRTALTHLSNLDVMGVSSNYDIDALPENPGRAQLPLLLVLPIKKQEDGIFQESGGAFEAIAFSDGARTISVRVTHLLLLAPVGQSRGLRSHLPDLVTLMDNYFTALGADVDLGGMLLEAASVKVEPEIFKMGETSYYGCAFRHRWLLEV
ncbi:MAG: hypothetical protein ACPG7F_02505 [Aggregatilineales bacterium]